ncbi:MAG TPA: SCO family protein [Bryobacteraceae bacterium]|nr:SCO family protein [Bryobacteraceae bacterium]
MFYKLSFVLLGAALVVSAQPGQPAPAQQSYSLVDPNLKLKLPKGLEGVRIDQQLDQALPLNAQFHDEAGRTVALGSFFHGKPVLLAPVYYQCPMLCTEILNGMVSALKAVTFNPGRDFEVVAFSFDPRDTPETAREKRDNYVKRFGRPNTANGFHFLTGDEANIKVLTDALGFHYRWDPATQQFAHASAIMLATPEGRLSRYFYGVEYSPRDLRFGLVDASEHKIGNPVDAVLLFCFHYDPATGKYGAVAMNSLRAAGGVFAVVCGGFLFVAWRRDKRRDRQYARQHVRLS